MQVTKRDGSKEPLQVQKLHKMTAWACSGLNVSQSELELKANVMFFDGIKTSDVHDATIKAAAELISVAYPDYTFVAARLLAQKLYKEVAGGEYPSLRHYISKAWSNGLLDDRMTVLFDFQALEDALRPERDMQFTYLGLQTLADRYFLRQKMAKASDEGPIIELPQHFFMRVAMGLALKEDNPTARAIEFYDLLSSFDFMSSTPTLFNAGTRHSQLSSCYLNKAGDSISNDPGSHRYASIFGVIEESANLSKYAGGIGTDWTPVRSAGDIIKGTNGKSSGVVPYLKIYNDTAIAVNQGGKRKGSFAPYLESWHPDLYDFLELKKNSGDERKRAHDIYPVNWIPDLLMKRKDIPGAMWSFFSPSDFPELHELYGEEFETCYEHLEAQGLYRHQKPAAEVWRKMLTALFETGNPWITFKDECNRRNPQDHVGVIHSSNLCTEITLNTSDDETAVCNLGSVNLSRVNTLERLRKVIKTAIRMLDNVIDINFYPSDRAKASNLKHRPIGMGVMGYTELLVQRGIDWESEEHLQFADELFEQVSYAAIEASCELAIERGTYESFQGSKWSRGILPIDTARDKTQRLDWESLRAKVVAHGVRNSNMMAIAPTATISNIVGTTPCIEPIFEREFVKSNLSGSFLVVDPALRYGRPELCKEAFEIDQTWLIRAAAKRQKWIDQAQSLNIYAKLGTRGRDLDAWYTLAWREGLKTTYYLRTKSSVVKDAAKAPEAAVATPGVQLCSISDPGCESCQ